MVMYMAGSLFCHFNHKEVTRNLACDIFKSALKFIGLNENEYDTQSFKIGATTYAVDNGKSDDEIILMGRWKSQKYKRYIRIDTSS